MKRRFEKRGRERHDHTHSMIAWHPVESAIVKRVLWVRALRAFADGYVSLLLPVYLLTLGMSPLQVGIIATATLLGSGLLTLWVGFQKRWTLTALLSMAAVMMAGTGLGFATITDFWPLLPIAIVGTLNPSAGDVSIFLPLEHALLSQAVQDQKRTAYFARYSLVGTMVAALGTLAAGLPELLVAALHVSMKTALQSMFALYGVIGILAGLIYRGLPQPVASKAEPEQSSLGESKGIAYTLAALFSLDAFAGGFIVQSMFALWLFQKFQISASEAGTIFFWAGMLSALSYLIAVKIAGRFGLINTIVFTHLPSSILLIAIPFVPTIGMAVTLLLMRSLLSQMDVPTRSSYVMAVVSPNERAAAASVTSVPRSLAAAISPTIAGYILSITTFGWSLIISGVIKMTYDMLLYFTFRNVRPPEEVTKMDDKQ